MIEVREYVDPAGQKSLHQMVARAECACRRQGGDGARTDCGWEPVQRQAVGNGVLEYKIDFGPGYRIYFGRDGDRLIILLAGGSEEAPATGHRAGKGELGRLPERKQENTTCHSLKIFVKRSASAPNRNRNSARRLLREAIELMLSGDEKTGRAILRNYINATVGFRQLEEATSIPANSLMRMFGPNGNPSAKNLFGVLAHLQAQEGVNFELRPRRT